MDFLGWQISDDEQSKFIITLDDKELTGIKRMPRQDVYDAYSESYAGFIDVNQIGWLAKLNLTDLSLGTHILKSSCYDRNDNLLAEKEIQFTVI